MRLVHQHDLGGPGRVIVMAGDLPVTITVDERAEYRSVDVMADRGLAAWAGPIGPGGVSFGVEVGRPSLINTLRDKLGLRMGTSVSGGGSVVSSGRGSVAAGGSIVNCATGRGAKVTVDGVEQRLPEIGVHLTAPPLCTFEIRSHGGITVLHGDTELTVQAAEERGLLAVAR
ncbi:hypothetical protein SEA_FRANKENWEENIE_276 [Streptomyces phage Frankenweenie]|nr:hypothetical protein SEA_FRANKENWEENIE_276 [Streptomyces phage Frankenweenie]